MRVKMIQKDKDKGLHEKPQKNGVKNHNEEGHR